MKIDLFTLLKKYDVAGPRYTSYPTVPAWTESVGEGNYRKELDGLKAGDPLSLYFHLPFCEQLCHFCGCMKVITKNHNRSLDYVNRLLLEIDHVTACIPHDARETSQIHFGGGTPNFLQPEEMKSLMDAIREKFKPRQDVEIAIEMHPRTSTPAFCEMLAKLGFNRISLGVQDFDPVVQTLIHRGQTYEMTEAMVRLLRELGFRSFNFDLIYGLPGQTPEGWGKTLEQVIDLQPNRLAVYSYAHVPWLKAYQRSFKDSDLPPPEMKLKFYQQAYETLTDNGYRPIGMDHFALHDDELSRALDEGSIHRNFMGYSTKADAHQIGFGVSAISCVGGNYFQNLKDIAPYEHKMDEASGLATYRGYLLNRDDRIRRDLIQRIMCSGVVNRKNFGEKWELDFNTTFSEELEQLESFVADDLLTLTNEEIRLTHRGFLFMRNIAMVIDRYLTKIRQDSKTPVFSKTV